MNCCARWICALSLVVVLAWGGMPDASAWQDPSDFDTARRAFAAAIAAERSQAEDVARAEARALEAERALAAAGAEQARGSSAAVERLAKITASLSAKLDERERALLGPIILRAEHAVLRRWYDLLLPHAGVLGPGSLRMLRFHLEELQAAQAIAPQRVEFNDFRDLQRYLAELNRRLRQAAQESEKHAEALRLEAEQLAISQERALRDVAAGAGIDGALMDRWRTHLQAVDAARLALDDRQRAVIQAFDAYLAAGRRNSPPFVRRVAIRQVRDLYIASWTGRDGNAATSSTDADLRKLLGTRSMLEAAIGEIESQRRALAAERLPKAESMHRQSLLLYDRAQTYRSAIWNQAIAEVVIEVTITLTEVAVTGGAATLARKASEAALQAAESATARRALAGGLDQSVYASLKGTGARFSEQQLERVRAVGVRSGTFTQRYVEAAERAAASRGEDVYRAGRLAAIEADRVLDKVDMAEGLLQQAAEFERAQRRALADAEIFQDIAKREVSNIENLAGKGIPPLLAGGRGPSGAVPANRSLEFREGRPQVASGLIGDAIGLTIQNAVATGQYVFGATAREFIDADKATIARRLGALRQSANLENVQDAFKGQLRGNLVNVVGAATKGAVNAYFGAVADDALHDFYRMFAELQMDYALYWAGVETDVKFAKELAGLRPALAEVMAGLNQLSARRELRRDVDVALTDPSAPVEVEIEFSNVLDRRPAVTLGGVPVAMSPRGQLPAAVWRGSIAADALPRGQAPLAVELTPGTRPWAQLDTDPRTPAMPLTPQNFTWLAVEAGPDRHHRLKIEAGPGAVAAKWNSPWDSPWETSSGKMILVAGPGKTFRGSFDWHKGGRIIGSVDGPRRLVAYAIHSESNTTRCVTLRDGSYYWGRWVFTFNSDWSAFEGLWSHCDQEPSNAWSGKRSSIK